MQKEELTPARLDELLQRTQESSRALMRMILNILQIGKMEERRMPLRLEPVPLRQVVEENLDEMAALSARDGIRLENHVDETLPPIVADRELVSRVVANLLSNALKHTPGGGQVVFEARREGEEAVLTVRDTGEGIPVELQPRIFDKFVAGQADNGNHLLYDSGLGLTFCKLAVQCHGGRIWLTSKPGAGTTVYVALPVQGPPAGTLEAAGGRAAGASAA
jgi:NtrC-family two-component system sensor histidine kinase KinB